MEIVQGFDSFAAYIQFPIITLGQPHTVAGIGYLIHTNTHGRVPSHLYSWIIQPGPPEEPELAIYIVAKNKGP